MGVATALLGALAMPVHAQAADSPGSGAPVSQASTRLSAALQSLSLSGGDLCPAFAPATTAYTATVADDVSETTVSATPTAAGTVTVQPSDADLVAEGHQVSLSRGDNEITITVDEPGLAQRTYTIDVKRALLIGSAAQRVEYDLGTGFANLVRPCEVVIGDFHASVKLKDETDAIDSIDYATRTVQTTGNETKIVHTDSRYPQMTQVFKADSKNIKTHLVIEDATDPLSTNHMVPIKLKEGARVRMGLGGVGSNRVLRMPSFQPNGARWRFTAARGESLRSYNVTAFYENSSRKGLIIGAITHKNWRTAINLTLGSQGSGPLTELTVTSGVAAERDVMEHGYLSGNEISSATIVMGVYDDFRLGLEDYAEEVKRIQPKLASAPELQAWDNTTFSWKTWGKGSKRRALTYANVLEVLDFTEKLKDQGFANKGGYAIVAMAAYYWDIFTEAQWHTFADECFARGLLPGWYLQPWLLLDGADLDEPIYEDATYTFRDITTKDSDGGPLGITRPDGTKYALDPTHPGTRERIDKQMDWAITKGFRWLRMDFTYFGSLEGVYHDTSITTGIQAYNSGMKYITDKAGGRIHINLAISPYFPHNTGHSRRISGDVYHSISDVEYELNALAGGWWLGNGVLYEYLDPGVVDFHPTRDDAEMSRTKVNSAAITGMLQADDDWNKARFRGLAEEYYLNSDILALIGKARSFMPVELASGRGAPDSFVHHEDGADGGTTYYAVFNYSTSAATKTIKADRFIPDDWNDPQYEYAFYELWDKTTTIRKPGATWDLELPARGSKIYKITRQVAPVVAVTGLSNASTPENESWTSPAPSLANAVGNVTWSKEGPDADEFTLSAEGRLTLPAQDYEAPADANRDNVYEVTVRGTADNNTGTVAVRVTVTDAPEGPGVGGGGGGGSVNRPPVVERAIEDQSAEAGETLELDIRLNFYDRDQRALDYTVESSNAAVAVVDVDRDGVLTIRAIERGRVIVTVTAADRRGESASQSFAVTVTGPALVGLFPRASHPTVEGFVRVINRSDADSMLSITAIDDRGTRVGPVLLNIPARSVAHFNSNDLEEGERKKSLSGGIGQGVGDWRLLLDSEQDFEALAYVRTKDGFLSSMHDRAPLSKGVYRVPFFNPASNPNQVSKLRLINPVSVPADVTITSVDDSGGSPGSPVGLTVAPGESVTLSASDLEVGVGSSGALGDGVGKWQLSVESDQPIVVMNLLASPGGHLTNLSTIPIEPASDDDQETRPDRGSAGHHP